MLQTEFAFTLPGGIIDASGNLLREGVMRRAIAFDEVEPMQDPRVHANGAYLGLLVLSRVITRLGPISPVSPQVIGSLFATDYLFLQDLYVRINESGTSRIETECPTCGTHFALDLADPA
jgi:hypothetical protein